MKRRTFLKHLGAIGALGATSGLSLERAFAQASAQDGLAPKRLIVIGHCHGWPYDAWKMHPEELGLSTPWKRSLMDLAEEEFSQPLAPLYAYRKRLLPLDGVSLATAELDMDGNRHDGQVQA